ncbi:MAG TPA: YbdD/YjiX family protein [Steroidobacteraceae bacterium]|nr:YbdD/YjiX family protein [Steroidobacteraceae bacterium]
MAEVLLLAAPRFGAGLWGWLRALAGDDAYERFLAHHARSHPQVPPPTRAAFYEERERRKWSGVTRCC